MRKTHEQFIEELKQKKPNIEVIGEYLGAMIKIECKCKICNHIWNVAPNTLLGRNGCPKCSNRIKRTHKRFVEEMSVINDNIEILSQYETNASHIKCRCKLDGCIWEPIARDLLRGQGCPCCSGKVVIKGINDIATTAPWIVGFLSDKEEGFKYTKKSNRRIKFQCPHCSTEIVRSIKKIYTRGFRCPMCSDNVSYPNKFGRAFLKQLPINNLIPEYHPKWSNGRIYDNYFEYNNQAYILEMDGGFHYKEEAFNRTITEVQEIDRLKDKMATEHDIVIIRIDCRQSNKDYIKDKILSSALSDIFNLDYIDWDLCERASLRNIVFEVCEYYMITTTKITDIATHFQISVETVRKYLKKGAEFGFCDYMPKTRKAS